MNPVTDEDIKRALPHVGAEHEPPDGWQDRVHRAIAAERLPRARLARLWWAPTALVIVAAVLALALCGGCAADAPRDVVLPPSAFTLRLGQLVAPVVVGAGSVVVGAVVDVRCTDEPTTVITCVRATAPLDPATADAWCATDACGPAVTRQVIAMPPATVSGMQTIEIVVASPQLHSVQIRGAVVTVE